MDAILIDGLSFAMPLLVMAVGGIICERSGITMLALEGLQGFGAFAGAGAVVLAQMSLGWDSPWHVYIAMAAAMAGGLVFSLIHVLLCVKFKAQQVISGVVVNTLAVALSAFFTSAANAVATGVATNRFIFDVSPRFTVPILSGIPVFGAFFKNLYPFEPVIFAVVIIAWYALYKTRFGLRLRACGDNPNSLDAAGVSVAATQASAIMICGALAGLGGIFLAYSISGNYSPNIYMGYGYLSIAALIFGNWKIVPTFAVCMFFGLARSAGYQLCVRFGLSSSYNELFLAVPYVLTLILLVFFSKHNQPPRALGEIFDKSKR